MSKIRKIAIGSWAYAIGPYEINPVPIDQVVQKIGELKFDGIEIGGFRPHGHPDDYPSRKDRRKLVDMIEANGLGIAGYGADLWDYPFAEGDPKVIKRYKEMFDKSLDFCVDCGIETIRIDTVTKSPFPDHLDYSETWDRVVEMFKDYTIKASDVNMQVVWEFEPGFIFNKPSEIIKLVESVGQPNFKVLVDTCHAHMCSVVGAKQTPPVEKTEGGVLEFIKCLKGKIGHVHLIDSDNTLHDNDTSTHAPFGAGILDFEKMIPVIEEADYKGDWWTIDLCFWPDAWRITEESKRYLDELFSRI